MRYTVVWEKPAEAQFLRIWMSATDRQEVSDASVRIEHDLATDPDTKGTPHGIFHTYRDDPLAVLFHIDPGDCMVRIFQVRRTR